MTALYFARAAAAGPRRREAACQRRSSTPSNICSAARRREKLENFRGFGGAQSYPSRTKDADDVDFSTGSVGLGVAQTLFASLVQDYVARAWLGARRARRPHDRAGRRRRTRRGQYLRGAARGLEARRCATAGGSSTTTARASTPWCAKACGSASRACSAISAGTSSSSNMARCSKRPSPSPAARRCGDWIDSCPNQLYSALIFQGGAAWRKRLLDEIGDQGAGHAR